MAAVPTSKRALEFVLAALHPTPRAWNLYPTLEAAEQAAPEVNKQEHPDTDDHAYKPMSVTVFLEKQRQHYLADPLVEITEERWWEMLECLPPLHWERADGVERFLICEGHDATFHHQFAQCDKRYYQRLVCRFDKSTWITRAEIERFLAAKAAEA